MKTRIRRISRKSFSVLLALVMILTTLAVGSVVEIHAYSGWKIYGNTNNWASDLWSGSGNSGTATIDASSLIGQDFEFKLVAEGTWCGTSGTSAVSLNNEVSLQWGSGNNVKYRVTKGLITISVNDTKVTVTEDKARYKAYYNTSKTSTGGTGVDLIPQSGSTNSRVGTASLSTNTKYYFYVKDVKESKYIRNGSGTMNNTENEIQLYDYGSNNSDSIDMTTNIAGTYTFTYDSSTKKIKTKYANYTMNVENDGHGTPSVSSTSVANYNGSTTYSAGTPSTGYEFDYWELTAGSVSPTITNSNKTNTSLTLSPTGNVSPIKLKAHYKLKTYTISTGTSSNGTVYIGTSANPSSTNSFTVNHGSTVYLANQPDAGYSFSTYKVNGSNISGSSFTATADSVVTAIFQKKTIHNITLPNPPSHATVSVYSSFIDTTNHYSSSFPITVVPEDGKYKVKIVVDSGYKINSLSVAGNTISEAANAEGTYETNLLTMGSADVVISVEIVEKDKFNGTFASSGLNGGQTPSFTGSVRSLNIGATANIGAPAVSGYTFDHWAISPAGAATFASSTSANTTLTVVSAVEATITAYYTEDKSTVTASAGTGGQVKYTSSGTAGSSCSALNVGIDTSSGEFYAVNNTGYTFSGWTLGAGLSAASGYTTSSNPIKVIVTDKTKARTMTANFTENMNTVTVNAQTGGKVKLGSGTAASSISVTNVGVATASGTITATADDGYTFTGWTVNSPASIASGSSSSASITVRASANATITANFSENMSNLYVATSNSSYGSVSKSRSTIGISTGATITATPVTGYRFVNWTVPSGINITDANSAETTVKAASYNSSGYTLTANFEEITHTVTIAAGPGGKTNTNSVTGVGKYTSSGDITATPYTGFAFEQWSLPSSGVTLKSGYTASSTTIKINATADSKTVTARFEQTRLYLSPEAGWTNDNARFAVYFYNNSSTNFWVDMDLVPGETEPVYRVDIPAGFDKTNGKFIFVRMNGSTTTNNWSNKWNQTEDLSMDVSNTRQNKYTITEMGSSSTNASCTRDTVVYIEPKTYDVTVTAGQNGSVTYNGNVTVSAGSSQTVQIRDVSKTLVATPETGYEVTWSYTGSITVGDVYSPNTTVSADSTGTLTATFTKINYDLTSAVTNNGGTIKITSDAAGQNTITTAQINDIFYVTVNPGTYFRFSSFTISPTTANGGPSNQGLVSGYTNVYKFKMKSSAATITANYIAKAPVWGGDDSIECTKGEQITYNPVVSTWTRIRYRIKLGNAVKVNYTDVSPASPTITYTPTEVGTYTMELTAYNEQTGTSANSSRSPSVSIVVSYVGESIIYYVDMHDDSLTANNVKPVISFMDSAGENANVLVDENGDDISFTLTNKQNGIYYNSAAKKTPVGAYATDDVYVRVSAKGVNTISTLSKQSLHSSGTMWFESANDSSVETAITIDTTAAPTNTATFNGATFASTRVYAVKPISWDNWTDKWTDMYVYYWGGANPISNWNAAKPMTYVGKDATYHYYYCDIPSDVSGYLFQGKDNGSIKGQSVNITLDTKDGYNYKRLLQTTSGGNRTVEDVVDSEGDRIAPIRPSFTKWNSIITMNKSETEASVKPLKYQGADVSYSSSDTSVVTVNSSGVITALKKGEVTITTKVYGTVGAGLTTHQTDHPDYIERSTTVHVHDPSSLDGYHPMSYETQETRVGVKTVTEEGNSLFPAYIDSISTTLSGVANGNTYTGSGIINDEDTTEVDGDSKVTEYSIKYAKPNNIFAGYNAIRLEAEITTKSIRRDSGHERYGFSEWQYDEGTTDATTEAYTASSNESRSVTNAVETTKATINLDGETYKEVFAPYDYTDVTFTFYYDEYKPGVDGDGLQVFFYDPTYAAESGRERVFESSTAAYQASHTRKSYVLSDIEVRPAQGQSVLSTTSTRSELIAAAEANMHNIKNNYYTYSIDTAVAGAGSGHHLDVTVYMQHSPKEYTVKLNNIDYTRAEPMYYQSAVEVKSSDCDYASGTSVTWKDNKGNILDISPSYSFRIVENTVLTVEEPQTDNRKNSSTIKNAGYGITHEKPKDYEDDPTAATVEKLQQNFYVADFFLPDTVEYYDEVEGIYKQSDDVKFVGGGELYYSVKENSSHVWLPTNRSLVTLGYVDGSDGEIGYNVSGQTVRNTEDIEEALMAWIKDTYEASHPAESQGLEDDEEFNSVAFATRIEDTVYGGKLAFNYYPFEEYERSNGALVTRQVDGRTVYTANENKNLFRYSHTMGAYQYIYGIKVENSAANADTNMRVYSYYIYSYLAYDDDENPYTEYKVIVSTKEDAAKYVDTTASE